MKRLPVYILCLLLLCSNVYAGSKNKKEAKGPPRSEALLVGDLLNCLMYADTITYSGYFPDFDTLWKKVIEYTAIDEKTSEEINHLRQHPEKVQQFDPYFNHDINRSFMYVVNKGTDSGIHWHDIVLLRYELKKIRLTRDMVGYELISPIRFRGFVFVEDMLTRKTWCFSVNEMQNFDNYWFGGQVINIFEANTVDEYLAKEFAEKRRKKRLQDMGVTEEELAASEKQKKKEEQAKTMSSNPLMVSMGDDEDEKKVHKEVMDRKYYVGTFDNDIKVKLYVRYIKGNCPGGICSWEAIYKFGDQDEYIKLDVEKKPDSTWEFTEDPPIGGMDLKLKGKTYTGTWMSSDNETGYDVRMSQMDVAPARIKELDDIIEKGDFAHGIPAEKKDEDARGQDEGYQN
ncbi:MAG: hypothetical protein JSS96_11055 [Bacteroidetes bacterium]|nr:hypothetical protein [Bacteroidota bacterium]